jgi:hypothetical protein
VNYKSMVDRVLWWVLLALIVGSLLFILQRTLPSQEISVREAAEDERTYWYNKETLPECYISPVNGVPKLFGLGFNIAAPGLDRTGSANNEHRWLHAAGMDNVREHRAERFIWLPEDTWIELYRYTSTVQSETGPSRFNGMRHNGVGGTYPIGTLVAELVYAKDELFEMRHRRKVGRDEWETGRERFSEVPVGYAEIDNCVRCHEDVGKHSMTVDGQREWYGYVRGLEKGGPIHFYPYDFSGVVRNPRYGSGIRIRDDVKNFVRWKK